VADVKGPEADGYIAFPMREAVRAWVDGTRPNQGLMIRYSGGDPGNRRVGSIYVPFGQAQSSLSQLCLRSRHPTDDPSLTSSTVVEAVPDGVVLSGYPVDASSVRFDVALDADLAALAPLYNPLSDVPCQPGDGDAWR
jgi:hypothetical protein